MLLSVVVPAFNEEIYLPDTLSSLRDSASICRRAVELIVVDNASADRTADIARSCGAKLVYEALRNISKVRNTGANSAHGDVLVFVDADTIVPPHFLSRIAEAMDDPRCVGGSVDIVHTPSSRLLRTYLKAWRWLGTRLSMSQ